MYIKETENYEIMNITIKSIELKNNNIKLKVLIATAENKNSELIF